MSNITYTLTGYNLNDDMLELEREHNGIVTKHEMAASRVPEIFATLASGEGVSELQYAVKAIFEDDDDDSAYSDDPTERIGRSYEEDE